MTNRIKDFSKLSFLAATLLISSCSSDDNTINNIVDDETPDPQEETITIADLNQVFNKYKLEDRTDSDAIANPSGVNNGYATMLTNANKDEYYVGLTDFNNIEQAIDLNNPSIIASQFAVFLTTSGSDLNTQNGFDEGDRPVYIGTLVTNGENVIKLIPATENGGSVIIGGQTIETNPTSALTLNSDGFIVPQKSTGSRNTWYDWLVLHPFEGDNLRPISYAGIVADLDADHQLEQNFELTYNAFNLEDRTDGDGVTNPSGIDNSYASIVSYDDANYLRLTDFNNIEASIDLNYPAIEASSFAIFLTTAGAALNTQNGYDVGDRPVYLGTLEVNGFQDIALKPYAGNETGAVSIGANETNINTNPNIQVNDSGDIIPQTSTGSRALAYDWIVLHPLEGDNLRPIGYPGVVADLNAE